MNNKVLVAIYILSTPKLDKNVPETTKYTFYDILASNQDILVIFSPLYMKFCILNTVEAMTMFHKSVLMANWTISYHLLPRAMEIKVNKIHFFMISPHLMEIF